MHKLVLSVLILYISQASASKNPLTDIKNILKEITKNHKEKHQEPYYLSYSGNEERKQDPRNLDDGQTLNVLLELNGEQKGQFDRLVEKESAERCLSGRCDCSGARCGSQKKKLIDNFDHILVLLLRQDNSNEKNLNDNSEYDYDYKEDEREILAERNDRFEYPKVVIDAQDRKVLDKSFKDLVDKHPIILDTLLKRPIKSDHKLIQVLPKDSFEILQTPLHSKEKYGSRITRTGKKRVLPLTNRQRGRMLNKFGTGAFPKWTWRRSSDQNAQLGVPFEMDVQGIGQLNPWSKKSY